ncbi:hypothetical protein ACFY8B_23690 [Streptomyces sp. NPDC012751]|uniref:hypothetical protein n=1 Tax=Streptomyces sp. NPDC012751 TaxID=3364846 RepID=UPI0036C195B8
MTSPTAPAVDLDLLRELFLLEPHKPAASVLRRARAAGGQLVPLVLSVAEREGTAMGSGTRAELVRMRARSGIYDDIARRVSAVPGARVVKGPSLAAHYPPGVLRPSGDLDVVVEGEQTLWAVADQVLADWPVAEINLAIQRLKGDWHLVLVLNWPSREEPLGDPEFNVEISTLAFSGEPGGVPPRIALPPDGVVADILMLAEERFQRPFGLKDSLDLALVLAGDRAPAARPLADQAAALRLAPELLELCERTRAWPSLAASVPSRLLDALQQPSVQELRRRATGEKPLPREFLPPDAAAALGRAALRALTTGLPVHGMLLGRRTPSMAPTAGLRFRSFSRGTLIRTPVADFLMVTEEVVDPDQYAAALAELPDVFPL